MTATFFIAVSPLKKFQAICGYRQPDTLGVDFGQIEAVKALRMKADAPEHRHDLPYTTRIPFYRKWSRFARGRNIFVGLYKNQRKKGEKSCLKESRGGENALYLADPVGPGGLSGPLLPPV